MKLEDLRGKTVGVCVSGGLDSKTICCVLKDAGVKVKAFSANVGQPDEKDINDIKKKMAPTGVETTIVDVTKEMADICFETVKCQAMYDGGYWNSTGIARAVTVQKLLPAMKKAGCVALVHGATGRGNDQMRFERYTNVMDPTFGVYAPWRDADLLKKFPGRTQMVAFLAERGITAFVGTKKKYSTDANLAGLSHEAEDLESMETSMRIVKPTMGVWPEKAPNKVEKVTLKFEKGRCVAINGKKLSRSKVAGECWLISDNLGDSRSFSENSGNSPKNAAEDKEKEKGKGKEEEEEDGGGDVAASMPLPCMAVPEEGRVCIDLNGGPHQTMLGCVLDGYRQAGGKGTPEQYCAKVSGLCPPSCRGAPDRAGACFDLIMQALKTYDPRKTRDPWPLTRTILENDR